MEQEEQESPLDSTASPFSANAGRVIYPAIHPASPARTLFVCAAPQCALGLDLAAWRAVRAAVGLGFQRVLAATRRKFAEHLRRERGLGRPVELLHLAVPASPQGLEFADGQADGAWLSARLSGVHIMLLAPWTGELAASWPRAVPFVITLGKGIDEEGAAALCREFWCQIGLGLEPGPALDEALRHSPPAVGQHVARHW